MSFLKFVGTRAQKLDISNVLEYSAQH